MNDNSNITDMATRKPYRARTLCEFMVSYDCAEYGEMTAILYAKDLSDAEYQLRSIKRNGRVVGEIV